MRADYHLHCEFSDDSREPMENQIERAIALGLDEMCFTDHVDYGIKKDWSEGNILWRNMDGRCAADAPGAEPLANVDYPAYFAKLHKMQDLYKDRITVKQGLEFGIQSITVDRYKKLYDTYKDELDFVLFSMHQVDNMEFWTGDFQRGRTQQEYNEIYYKEILKTMQMYKDYSVLAHLDLIVRYDPAGVYPFEKVEDIVAEILKQAIRDDKGIEINTSSWHYKLTDTQPSRAILRLYKDLGGKILTTGSDGHNTEGLGAHFDDACAILRDDIGFTEFCTFDKMTPVFHKL